MDASLTHVVVRSMRVALLGGQDRLGVRAPDLRDSSIERLQRPNKTSV